MLFEDFGWCGYSSGTRTFDSPGGLIRVIFTYTGSSSIPSLEISDMVVYQYSIDLTLDMPSTAHVGDTVSIASHAVLQNGDVPDYRCLSILYDYNGWSPEDQLPSSTAITVLSRTDSTITLIWNTPGLYEIAAFVSKDNVFGDFSGSQYAFGDINISPLSGIETAEGEEEILICCIAGGIRIDGALDERVAVYDIMGREIANVINRGGIINMPSTGVYIVKVRQRPAKKVVVVK